MSGVASSYNVFQNYVGGRWVSAERCSVVERRNPANLEDVVGCVPLTSREDAEKAVQAAVAAQERWRGEPAPRRGQLLAAVARLLERRGDQCAALITREQGKTIAEATGEVKLAIQTLDYMAGEGWRLAGTTLPSEHSHRFVYTVREPVGVVGLITPWNFPLAVPLWKIAPALVCGNTVVWKPSRLSPAVSDFIVRLFIEADLPAGVLNLVNGAGKEAGGAIVAHPSVRGISFTSSFDVGVDIYATAARLMKKVQCEAGGKNAVVVLEDADVQLAADSIVAGAFGYAGQRCTATSRVIVVDPVADALVEAIRVRASALRVGSGIDPTTDMGPIADETQMERVLAFIERGRVSGETVCGGGRLSGDSYDRGLFVAPTVFDRLSLRADVVTEEIFGPVLSITRVRDLPNALIAANDNRYGMTAAVFTRDVKSFLTAASSLVCGIVHLNAATIGAEMHVPFGGIKDAGVGEREMGAAAVGFYSELKVVYVSS